MRIKPVETEQQKPKDNIIEDAIFLSPLRRKVALSVSLLRVVGKTGGKKPYISHRVVPREGNVGCG